MSDDPFDDLDPDAYRDREGDPFEAFDDDDDHDDHDDHDDGSDSREDTDRTPGSDEPGASEKPGASEEPGTSGDPFEYLGGGPAEGGEGEPDGTTGRDAEDAGDGDRPELATGGTDRTVDVSGDVFGDVDVSRGDPFESADSPFRQVDVDSVDPDEVWERFTGETERVEQARSEALGGESVPEDAADVVEVPKGRFCQTCPHFSAPPETACNHPGTEVLTFVGTDEVRVSNCPIVRERRELGETYD